jgi:hypothetical protein
LLTLVPRRRRTKPSLGDGEAVLALTDDQSSSSSSSVEPDGDSRKYEISAFQVIPAFKSLHSLDQHTSPLTTVGQRETGDEDNGGSFLFHLPLLLSACVRRYCVCSGERATTVWSCACDCGCVAERRAPSAAAKSAHFL